MKWFFDLKNTLKARLVDERLEIIVNNIEENKYKEALQNIVQTKEYRKTLNKVEKDKMTKPSKGMYENISKYDKEFYNLNNE